MEIIGIEAGGRGKGLGENAATLSARPPGVLHGSYSMLLQDEHGQVQETHSVSAGLDYPGVGPEHALLLATGRVRYESAERRRSARGRARSAASSEGILPALESAHALAGAKRWAQKNPGKRILIGLSGRGDKDMPTLQKHAARGRTAMSPRDRISASIRSRRAARRRPALVAFLTAGYPKRERFREHLQASPRGADVVEIGVPFTDPMADGVTSSAPATQRSCRA